MESKVPEHNLDKTDEIECIILDDQESEEDKREESASHDPYNSVPDNDRTDNGRE